MRRCPRLWPAVFFLLLTIADKKWYRIDRSTFRVGERLGLLTMVYELSGVQFE